MTTVFSASKIARSPGKWHEKIFTTPDFINIKTKGNLCNFSKSSNISTIGAFGLTSSHRGNYQVTYTKQLDRIEVCCHGDNWSFQLFVKKKIIIVFTCETPNCGVVLCYIALRGVSNILPCSPFIMALAGVRVIELAGLAPAPFCGMILADFGAKVIRVDRTKVAMALDTQARGKLSVAIDLKTPKGVDLLRKLCVQSDVVLEPYRKGQTPGAYGTLKQSPFLGQSTEVFSYASHCLLLLMFNILELLEVELALITWYKLNPVRLVEEQLIMSYLYWNQMDCEQRNRLRPQREEEHLGSRPMNYVHCFSRRLMKGFWLDGWKGTSRHGAGVWGGGSVIAVLSRQLNDRKWRETTFETMTADRWLAQDVRLGLDEKRKWAGRVKRWKEPEDRRSPCWLNVTEFKLVVFLDVFLTWALGPLHR